jgi:hypothetical protein
LHASFGQHPVHKLLLPYRGNAAVDKFEEMAEEALDRPPSS